MSFISKNIQLILLITLGWVIGASINEYLAISLVTLSFLVVIFKQNHFLLLAFFLLVLLLSDSRNELMQFAVTIKPIIGVLVGGYGVFLIYRMKIPNSLFRSFIPFAVIALLTSIFSTSSSHILKSISYILILISVPAVFMASIKEDEKRTLRDYFGLVIVILGLGILIRFILPEYVTLNGRYNGLLGNPNGLGIFLIVTYFLFQITIRNRSDLFSKNERILLLSLFFASLLLCQSRTSILVIVLYHTFFWLNKKAPILSVLMLVLSISFYSYIMTNIFTLIQVIGLEEYARIETLEAGSGRLIAWEFIWERIKEGNLFFGNGIGATEEIFKTHYNYLSQLGHQGNAHNSYLTFWYDIGLLGLIAYLGGVLVNFFNAKKDPIIFPIIAGVFVSGYFESWLTASLNPFTINFILLIVLLHHFVRSKSIKFENEVKLSNV